jgi:hypothetical protein
MQRNGMYGGKDVMGCISSRKIEIKGEHNKEWV